MDNQNQMFDASPKMLSKEQVTQSKITKSLGGTSEVTNPVMHGASKVAVEGNKIQTRKHSLGTNSMER